MDNLLEEVRDTHPKMLRKFEMAANAQPTEADAFAVYPDLSEVRLFIGRLSAAPILATMAFFESFIQRFMPTWKNSPKGRDLRKSSTPRFTASATSPTPKGSSMLWRRRWSSPADSREPAEYLYEGVHLLRALIERMFTGASLRRGILVAQQRKSDCKCQSRRLSFRKLEEVRRASKKPGLPLTDDLALLESGLDSLGLAILVTRLEDTLGVDPFTDSDITVPPVTLGEFIRLYELAGESRYVD